ncbi:hypothetical protein ACHAWF_007487 [Thalassiosira exigua]
MVWGTNGATTQSMLGLKGVGICRHPFFEFLNSVMSSHFHRSIPTDYVSHADMDGDGDYDLIAVDHAENSVTVFYAATECDGSNAIDGNNTMGPLCCLEGTEWNGTACELCPRGKYGSGLGADARCVECHLEENDGECRITGRTVIPATCGYNITRCMNVEASIAECACPADTELDDKIDACVSCPEGQVRPDTKDPRGVVTIGDYQAWEAQQGRCFVPEDEGPPLQIIIPVAVIVGLLVLGLIFIVARQRHTIKYHTRDVNNAPRSGTIAFAFTDIEGSTALWDISKSTMSKALEVHHNVIRKVIDRHKAYEVKTIGDSFMVALSSADAAVLLANDIQEDLLHADWPLELAGMPSAGTEFVREREARSSSVAVKEVPKPVYRGLRVRIGVHLGMHSALIEEGGQVQTKYDKVAKGFDYYGPAVNAAARIEALAFGGQTLISSEIETRLSQPVKDACTVHVVGNFHLKGIEDDVFMYQVLPRSLKRTFQGVFRRRDSEGGMLPGMIGDGSIREGASFIVGNDDLLEDDDMMCDVMSLTPIQLQNTVNCLRTKVTSLEDQLLTVGRRVCDNVDSMEDIEEISLEQGGEDDVAPQDATTEKVQVNGTEGDDNKGESRPISEALYD